MAEEVGEAVAEGEGFAGEVCGVIGIAGGAVVAEVTDFKDVGGDAAGFAVPAGRGIVEGHCLNGHSETLPQLPLVPNGYYSQSLSLNATSTRYHPHRPSPTARMPCLRKWRKKWRELRGKRRAWRRKSEDLRRRAIPLRIR